MIKDLYSQINFVKNHEHEDKFLSSDNDETVTVVLNETEAIYGADDSCNKEYLNKN